jgi:hypothetical protein
LHPSSSRPVAAAASTASSSGGAAPISILHPSSSRPVAAAASTASSSGGAGAVVGNAHLLALCNGEYNEQPWTSPADEPLSAEVLAARSHRQAQTAAAIASGSVGSSCLVCGSNLIAVSWTPCCTKPVCRKCLDSIHRERIVCTCREASQT